MSDREHHGGEGRNGLPTKWEETPAFFPRIGRRTRTA
jgi:hypothetical protein